MNYENGPVLWQCLFCLFVAACLACNQKKRLGSGYTLHLRMSP